MRRPLDRARFVRVLLAIVIAAPAAVMCVAAAGAAQASGSGPIQCPPGQSPVTNPITGVVTCVASVSGGGGTTPPGSTSGGGSGSGPTRCTTSADLPLPCFQAGAGYWDSAIQCYVELNNPQPPAGDPAWGTHTPGDGSIWTANCREEVDSNGPFWLGYDFWAASPPVGPTPAALLTQAEAELTMRGPQIGTAPQYGGMTLVGLPVWMWTARSAQTWGPQTVTINADGMTLTATALAQNIAWNMGDGGTVSCGNPGSDYQASYGGEPSPTCGYTYQDSGTYAVTGTTTWVISWTAAEGGIPVGAGTVTPPKVQSTTTVKVGELQVLNNG